MERVEKFLKEAGTYYLATVEGDQPRVSFHLKQKDIDYINEKGLDTIREHAKNFIAKREAPVYMSKKFTPDFAGLYR